MYHHSHLPPSGDGSNRTMETGKGPHHNSFEEYDYNQYHHHGQNPHQNQIQNQNHQIYHHGKPTSPEPLERKGLEELGDKGPPITTVQGFGGPPGQLPPHNQLNHDHLHPPSTVTPGQTQNLTYYKGPPSSTTQPAMVLQKGYSSRGMGYNNNNSGSLVLVSQSHSGSANKASKQNLNQNFNVQHQSEVDTGLASSSSSSSNHNEDTSASINLNKIVSLLQQAYIKKENFDLESQLLSVNQFQYQHQTTPNPSQQSQQQQSRGVVSVKPQSQSQTKNQSPLSQKASDQELQGLVQAMKKFVAQIEGQTQSQTQGENQSDSQTLTQNNNFSDKGSDSGRDRGQIQQYNLPPSKGQNFSKDSSNKFQNQISKEDVLISKGQQLQQIQYSQSPIYPGHKSAHHHQIQHHQSNKSDSNDASTNLIESTEDNMQIIGLLQQIKGILVSKNSDSQSNTSSHHGSPVEGPGGQQYEQAQPPLRRDLIGPSPIISPTESDSQQYARRTVRINNNSDIDLRPDYDYPAKLDHYRRPPPGDLVARKQADYYDNPTRYVRHEPKGPSPKSQYHDPRQQYEGSSRRYYDKDMALHLDRFYDKGPDRLDPRSPDPHPSSSSYSQYHYDHNNISRHYDYDYPQQQVYGPPHRTPAGISEQYQYDYDDVDYRQYGGPRSVVPYNHNSNRSMYSSDRQYHNRYSYYNRSNGLTFHPSTKYNHNFRMDYVKETMLIMKPTLFQVFRRYRIDLLVASFNAYFNGAPKFSKSMLKNSITTNTSSAVTGVTSNSNNSNSNANSNEKCDPASNSNVTVESQSESGVRASESSIGTATITDHSASVTVTNNNSENLADLQNQYLYECLSKKEAHCLGVCTPCFYVQKVGGCQRGEKCSCCHLCTAGRTKVVDRYRRKRDNYLPKRAKYWDVDQIPKDNDPDPLVSEMYEYLKWKKQQSKISSNEISNSKGSSKSVPSSDHTTVYNSTNTATPTISTVEASATSSTSINDSNSIIPSPIPKVSHNMNQIDSKHENQRIMISVPPLDSSEEIILIKMEKAMKEYYEKQQQQGSGGSGPGTSTV